MMGKEMDRGDNDSQKMDTLDKDGHSQIEEKGHTVHFQERGN
jgi:hypothetical protein